MATSVNPPPTNSILAGALEGTTGISGRNTPTNGSSKPSISSIESFKNPLLNFYNTQALAAAGNTNHSLANILNDNSLTSAASNSPSEIFSSTNTKNRPSKSPSRSTLPTSTSASIHTAAVAAAAAAAFGTTSGQNLFSSYESLISQIPSQNAILNSSSTATTTSIKGTASTSASTSSTSTTSNDLNENEFISWGRSGNSLQEALKIKPPLSSMPADVQFYSQLPFPYGPTAPYAYGTPTDLRKISDMQQLLALSTFGAAGIDPSSDTLMESLTHKALSNSSISSPAPTNLPTQQLASLLTGGGVERSNTPKKETKRKSASRVNSPLVKVSDAVTNGVSKKLHELGTATTIKADGTANVSNKEIVHSSILNMMK